MNIGVDRDLSCSFGSAPQSVRAITHSEEPAKQAKCSAAEKRQDACNVDESTNQIFLLLLCNPLMKKLSYFAAEPTVDSL